MIRIFSSLAYWVWVTTKTKRHRKTLRNVQSAVKTHPRMRKEKKLGLIKTVIFNE